MSLLNVTDENFDKEVLQSSTPVLIDFWAVWCGPCRAISPIVDELSVEYAGKLKVVKMNVDENQQVPIKYGVRSIPTLLVFENGQLKDQIIGALSKTQLIQKLKSVV